MTAANKRIGRPVDRGTAVTTGGAYPRSVRADRALKALGRSREASCRPAPRCDGTGTDRGIARHQRIACRAIPIPRADKPEPSLLRSDLGNAHHRNTMSHLAQAVVSRKARKVRQSGE